VSRLRDRVTAVGARGDLVLYGLDRATEITCARCAGHQATRWIAVLASDWRALWCKSCFLAMPSGSSSE
jgi:hypothetical protein